MSDLRTAAQQALEALKSVQDHRPNDETNNAITALRAALAQQDEPEAYGYASRLAVAIWEKHYKDTAPQWKPLDDLMGVLTQIDNMTSGLTRLAQQPEPVQEPVAKVELMTTGGNAGLATRIVEIDDHLRERLRPGQLLYTAPPKAEPHATAAELRRLSAVEAQRDALLEKIKAVIAAEQSEGAGRGGFVNTPPTREHQRRVAQAWQELHAAIKAVEGENA